MRRTPPGTLIARWYCRESHTTFSLLPDCLAARLPGTLARLEEVVAHPERASSLMKAADHLRGYDVQLACAPGGRPIALLRGQGQRPAITEEDLMNHREPDHHHDAEERLRREVALFRYGVIADLAQVPPGTPGLMAQLRAKAKQQYTIPGTLRTRVAAETLRDWLQLYRRGGFDALYPKRRADLGRPKRLAPEVAELLIALKTTDPSWSVRKVIAGAIGSGHLPDGVRLAHSTVHRLLRAEGAERHARRRW